MSAGLQLSQRLSQQMVLSPQLQHSLALLQAPVLELKAMVEQELQLNPVLEEIGSLEIDVEAREAQAEAEAAAEDSRIRSDPLVQAAFTAFPEAELLGTDLALSNAS